MENKDNLEEWLERHPEIASNQLPKEEAVVAEANERVSHTPFLYPPNYQAPEPMPLEPEEGLRFKFDEEHSRRSYLADAKLADKQLAHHLKNFNPKRKNRLPPDEENWLNFL